MGSRPPYLKGFTLVELSIVILIIGLLTAGIAGGRQLIKQAELRTTIKEFNSYRQDYLTFVATYGAPPGDFAGASILWGTNCHGTAVNCNGNGDGNIDNSDSPPVGNGQGIEVYRAYKHLSLSGIANYSFPVLTDSMFYLGATDGNSVDPPEKPKQFPSACYFYNTSTRGDNAVAGGPINGFVGYKNGAAGKYGSPWFPDTVPAVYLGGIWGNVGGWDQTCTNPILNPVDMFNIDSKMDDGTLDSAGARGAGSGSFRTLINGASTVCANAGIYNLTGSQCLVGYKFY
jgi:prepilin-type N-terminal cleavage/methylation domain-containing protein